MNGLGEFLKGAREKKGLSPEDLSQTCGIHYQVIDRLEKGGSIPLAETLLPICKALEVNPLAALESGGYFDRTHFDDYRRLLFKEAPASSP